MSNYTSYGTTHQQPPLYYPNQNGFTPTIYYDNSPMMYSISSPNMANGTLQEYAHTGPPPTSNGPANGPGASSHQGGGHRMNRNNHAKSSDHYGNSHHPRSKHNGNRHHNGSSSSNNNNSHSNGGYQYHQSQHQPPQMPSSPFRPFYPSNPPSDFPNQPQIPFSPPQHHLSNQALPPPQMHHIPPPFIPAELHMEMDPDPESLLDQPLHTLPQLSPPPHQLPSPASSLPRHSHLQIHPRPQGLSPSKEPYLDAPKTPQEPSDNYLQNAKSAQESPKQSPKEFVHCAGQITKVWFSVPDEPFPKRRSYYRRLERLKKVEEEMEKEEEPASEPVAEEEKQEPVEPVIAEPASPPPALVPNPLAATPTKPASTWAQRLQETIGLEASPVSPRSKQSSSTSNGAATGSDLAKAKPAAEDVISPRFHKKEPLGIVLHDYSYQKVEKNAMPQIYSRGIINTGNICFMNSILQALVHCAPFYQLLEYIASNSVFSIKSETPLLDALINLTRECTEKPKSTSTAATLAAAASAAATASPSSDVSAVSTAATSTSSTPTRVSDGDTVLVNGLRNINMQPMSPESFYNTVRIHPRFVHYKRGRQEDAEEFLGYLLEALHDEFLGAINKSKAALEAKKTKKKVDEEEPVEDEWKEVGKNNKSMTVQQNKGFGETPITKLFGGQLKSTLTASNLKTPSITRDPFQQIQLDISDDNVHSIEDAFVNLAQSEQLQYSTSTKQDVRATKQILIDEMPEVLIVHLKRFAYTNDSAERGHGGANGFGMDSVQKISKPISFPEHLRIPREAVTANVAVPEPPTYTLCGVVYHHGPSATAGHYTVDVKTHSQAGNGSDEWINIDDVTLAKTGAPLPATPRAASPAAAKPGLKKSQKSGAEGEEQAASGVTTPSSVSSSSTTSIPPWALTESTKTAYILFYKREKKQQ